jgi:hypothetical protein
LVAQITYRGSLPLFPLPGRWISALGHIAKKTLGFLAGGIRRPGCSMPAYCISAQPTFCGTIAKNIGDGFGTLTAGTEAGNALCAAVPNLTILSQRPDIPKTYRPCQPHRKDPYHRYLAIT